ncbi:MAG TPA: hypothetical protein VFX16_01040 [Pseudonocardiaceae bacterium]|nr:hypothetical protein [Pseudonocardiaceae bacterium]
MDLTPYVDSLRDQLAVSAEAGGVEARALAERLIVPLESAVRLALLDALSSAADEITRDLAPGSVQVRLRRTEPTFVVTPPPAAPAYDEPALSPAPLSPAPPSTVSDGDDGAMARINFRLTENLKARVEDAAGQAGLSVNAWLVRAAAAALGSDDRRRPGNHAPQSRQRFNGWVR